MVIRRESLSWVFLIAILVFSMVVTGTYAQESSNIEGKMTDYYTGNPIMGATATAKEAGLAVETDVEGFYRLSVTPGVYNVTAKASGYFSQWAIVDASTPGTYTKDFILTGKAHLFIDPSYIVDPGKGVGTTFSITVNITDVTDLYTVAIKMRWGGRVLDALSLTEGPFLKLGGTTFWVPKIFNGPDPAGICDYLIIGDTLVAAAQGVSGNGYLATATFQVEEAPGESVLDLFDVELVDSKGNIMGYVGVTLVRTSEDGYFANIGWADKGYPGDVDGQPTDAPAGQKGYGATPRDVAVADLMIVARAMGYSGNYLADPLSWPPPWNQYNSAADLNDDGRVGAFDLATVGVNYGEPRYP